MGIAKELLLQCKIALGVKTDYKLAQALEIDRARVADYLHGKRIPDAYACVRIALILKEDPIKIIAMIEAETEKNDKKREFWQGFLMRVSKAGRTCTLVLICTTSLLSGLQTWANGASRFGKFPKFA